MQSVQLTWESVSTLVAVGTAVSVVWAWAVRLIVRGTITDALEGKFVSKPVCDERHKAADREHEDLDRRLDRVEHKGRP